MAKSKFTISLRISSQQQNNIFVNIMIALYITGHVYLKVDGGQLESLRYFDHHTHFTTCTVITYRVIICCKYTFLPMLILCKQCE